MRKVILAILILAVLGISYYFTYMTETNQMTISENQITNQGKANQFELNNGMEVIVIPNNKVPAVSHMVWYKIGAIDEKLGKSGIAHFLEHLMFKGTDKYPDGMFSKTIARFGGEDNAFTSYDFTAYYQNISKNKLELVMSMEADRMSNLNFDEEEVKKERNVILEERSMRVDNNPSALLREQVKAVLFKNHKYGTPLIGWRHEMEGLSLEDAKAWYEDYYAPNNAILVIAGDVTSDEVKQLAEKYYGTIAVKEVPKRNLLVEAAPLAAAEIVLKDKKVQTPEWSRYYISPSQNTENSNFCYPLIVLSKILGEGNTSKIYQKLVVDKELAVSAGSYYDDVNLGPSIFAVYAVPNEKTALKDMQLEIEKIVQEVANGGFSEEDIEHAKTTLISGSIYSKEDLKNLSYLYGSIAASGVDISYVDNWEDNINSVTKDQIINAAKFVLNNDVAVTAKLLPEGSN